MLDIFANNPAFEVLTLSLALNRVPFVPGLIGNLGLFRQEPIATTTILIETRGTRLALVPEMPRGAPPTPDVEDRRSAVPFRIPHFPIRASIYADEVQNVRAFGSTDQLQPVQEVVNRREVSMSVKLDLTLEYLRLGAVKGILITAVDRITGEPLSQLDLFDSFHVTAQPVMDWPIVGAGAAGQEQAAWAAQLTNLCNGLGRAMADEVSGGMYQRIYGVCGSVFFDAFSQHPERRAAFIGMDPRLITDSTLGATVSFAGVTVQEYRGQVGAVRFVEPDLCHFFPVGAPDLFVETYAPADYMETVNTLAYPRYSKMEAMDFDKGVELEAQMNVLPLCTTPRALFTARAVAWEPGTTTAAAPSDNGQRRRAA